MKLQRLTAALMGLWFVLVSSVAVANYCGSIVAGGGAGSCSAPAPAEAAAGGMHTQVLCDSFAYTSLAFIDFDTADSLRWNDALWYQGHNSPASYAVNNPGITLFANANGCCNLATEFHDTSGGQFFTPPFFTEATLNCTDWCAFWFLSVNHTRGSSCTVGAPSGCAAEIDVIEGDPTSSTAAFQTLHRNSGGGSPGDSQTDCFGGGGAGSVTMANGGRTQGQVHTYGAMVTSSNVFFYVDHQLQCTVTTYDSTQQAYFMILGAGQGGVNGGANVGTAQSNFTFAALWQGP